ncbi:MAG: sulfatase-like hydrolase/transferase [Rhodospirillales bacterium]|nr:sulfatase-like hydrolase/transferase [Rhodospirillales bacterium]
MPQERPNILFIMSDQHTQRVMGCYGDDVVATPNLDRLANCGVTFDAAYTPSPLCVPARMSFLTGRYPNRQSCWTNSDMLPSDQPTIAHCLGAAGYNPILVGRMHSIGPDQLRGFVRREVGDHSTNWIGGVPHSLGVLNKTNDPYRVSLDKSGAGQSSYECHDDDVTAATLQVLDEIAEARKGGDAEPFALSVGYLMPHQPFVARPEFYDRYKGRVGLPDIPAVENEHPYMTEWRDFTGISDVPDDTAVRARTAYYALVEEMDAMIGCILDKLEELGLAENTLVVYTSDHGDQLGERGLWWKQTFYDESAKIPLLMSWPGTLPQGQHRGQVVNLIDLAATLLEAADAPPLPDADGRSFLQVARDGNRPWIDETFSEYCTDGVAPWTLPTPTRQRMIRTDRWKLNYYDGYRAQLFDMQNDPGETRDLALDPEFADLRDALIARVLVDWNPEKIADELAAKIPRKELLRDWSRAVKPADTYRWKIREEDNWLEESSS